jgi:hypothetical protein
MAVREGFEPSVAFRATAQTKRTLRTVTQVCEISPKDEPYSGSLLRYEV